MITAMSFSWGDTDPCPVGIETGAEGAATTEDRGERAWPEASGAVGRCELS